MQKCNENAADRYSYVGEIYTIGERARKEEILNAMPQSWSDLHKKGYIHIHDLDAYGLTNNCLTFNILNDFPYNDFIDESIAKKIIGTFDYIKSLFADIGNEQSGGMALANFDKDVAEILEKTGVLINDTSKEIISACIKDLILWCNNTHTRMGQTSYYVSLNIGLGVSEFARFLSFALLDEFEKCGDLVFKPNIIFKVKKGINYYDNDVNNDLFRKALLCSARKMIPTYVLCDSVPNKDVDPEKLAIMGCRTRVVADLFGESTSVGRGNIDNISINLPRIALEVEKENMDADTAEKIQKFKLKWDKVAGIAKDILLDRFNKVCARSVSDFPINCKHNLWLKKFDNVKEVFKHGTLSIGFIGLSEAIEVLTGKRFYIDAELYKTAIDFVKHMRTYCDRLRDQYKLNFSLLATSGELISGRFIDIDKQEFTPKTDIFSKGFYTNSFHINVDSDITAFEKIKLEGPFHEICNGGCITYVELGEAPISNDEGLREYIKCAINSGTHYLGFNFPKDVCNECGTSGVFDTCPVCGSKSITRIRRVSGYLEILDGFTKGKKYEEKHRKQN
ncbi:MAG: anaerobic ribonucleoside-triphosphate reductase [Clostridia bacterium]|nr:anaerobic ribonucleoside-triphosphate reductase [Clostridia bacterium]